MTMMMISGCSTRQGQCLIAAASRILPAVQKQTVTNGPSTVARTFSTRNSSATQEDPETAHNPSAHPQSFVKTHFEPGESNPHTGYDPLFRPPWKNRAKIISPEDFKNRPRANFNPEFNSLYDAGIVLSWLPATESDKIYQAYLDLMLKMDESKEDGGVTSHEYVMQVIAQKWNIRKDRVAAIVQLAHNEERIRAKGGAVHDDIQEYVDKKCREHIENAYREYGETDPETFVEETVGHHDYMDLATRTMVTVDDLADVNERLQKASLNDREKAEIELNSKIYREDVDENEKFVKINSECHKLIKSREVLQENIARKEKGGARWKWAAKIFTSDEHLNPRDDKQKVANTIIEDGGILRPVTEVESREVHWKPKRKMQEFLYRGVKEAWLEKKLRGKHEGWGRAERKVVEEDAVVIEAGTDDEKEDKKED